MGGGNQSEGTNNGQDTITWTGTGTANFNYTITGGALNPIAALERTNDHSKRFDYHRALDDRSRPLQTASC